MDATYTKERAADDIIEAVCAELRKYEHAGSAALLEHARHSLSYLSLFPILNKYRAAARATQEESL